MNQKKMNWKKMLLYLCFVILLAFFTFHILFKAHSAELLLGAFEKAKLQFAALGGLCMLIFLNCEAASIRKLMKTFHKKVSLGRSLSYSCAGFYFSAITPSATGGQPMQLYYMTRDGFGFAQSSFTLLTITAVYQMGVLLYGSTMVLIKWQYVMSQSKLIRWLLLFGILVNGFCACGILLIILNGLLAERAGMCLIHVLCRLKLIKDRKKARRRLRRIILEYSRGGAYLRQYPLTIAGLFLRCFLQLTALFLVPFFAAVALGLSAQPGEFLAMQSILSLAVTAIPLPGSIGASEGSFIALYTPFFGAGQSVSLMMLSRGISFYGLLLITGLMTAVLQLKKRQTAE